MDILHQILDYIARTNLFNFVIFAGIIIFLVKKLNVKSQLENSVSEVKETINDSETAKTQSEEKLSNIEESMKHISEEIDEILSNSEINAKLVGEKIISDCEHSVAVIQENAAKAIENSSIILKNDIIRRAALASVEVAKSHIIDELKRNPDLHNKLIEESVNSIEGIEL